MVGRYFLIGARHSEPDNVHEYGVARVWLVVICSLVQDTATPTTCTSMGRHVHGRDGAIVCSQRRRRSAWGGTCEGGRFV